MALDAAERSRRPFIYKFALADMNSRQPDPSPNQTGAVRRYDIYGPIHKALRLLMTRALIRFGSVDKDDEADIAAAVREVDRLVAISHLHYLHEESFLHPLLESTSPGSADQAVREHQAHCKDLDSLASAMGALLAADRRDRDRLISQIYRQLGSFVADNLQHMANEEATHNPVLWAHHDDAFLVQLEATIVQNIEPAPMKEILSVMLPALNTGERIELMRFLQSTVPSPAFEAVQDTARRVLDQHAWAKLARAIGVGPEPGLVTA